MRYEDVLREVAQEIEHAERKNGNQFDRPLGTSKEKYSEVAEVQKLLVDRMAAAGELTWMDIATEEVFETWAEDEPQKVRAEAIQAAAMFVQIVRKIDYDAEQTRG